MNEQYTPGKGIHQEDLNALTGYWHRETNHINDIVESSFKSAQDDAYARGYRRGRDDLIIIRKQRDELLAALESMVSVARLTIGWSVTPANADGPLAVAEKLIYSVKGCAK